MAWYKTGKVTVNTGSTSITGVGTRFVSNSRAGDGFRGPDGEWYEIVNYASETSLGIYPAYEGPSVSESEKWMIAPLQGYNKESADRLRSITDQIKDFDSEIEQAKAAADRASESETNAKTSELNSKQSELQAQSSSADALSYKNSAESAKVVAEKARDDAIVASGSVTVNIKDQGEWNANTGVYPTKPVVSSTWLVTGNGSATDGGVTIQYNVGDVLFWSIAINKFYKFDNTDAVSSVNGKVGQVVITKSDVNLANVDDTSDLNKPISNAQATAFSARYTKSESDSLFDTKAQVNTKIANLSLKSASKADILGVVSQSGGLPTGSIIERGSNSNGEYVKFADGTLICFMNPGGSPAIGANAFSAFGPYGTPANFINSVFFVTAVAVPAGSNDTYGVTVSYSLSSNTVGFVYRNGATAQSFGNIKILCIGRWY